MSNPWVRKEVIGDCVLYQGDCRGIIECVDYQSLVTDPPFGMNFRSNHRKEKHKTIKFDDDDGLLRWACGLPAKHSKYVFCRWDNIPDIEAPRSLITWVKNNHSMGDLEHEHGRKTEVCAFYNGPAHFFPNGRPNDVVFGSRTGNELHPTQKPVDLMRNIIEWTSGVVLDPFMGSGTTLVACAKMGRKGVGIELDPDYFQTACERVQKAYDQPDLFVAPPSKPKQEDFDL